LADPQRVAEHRLGKIGSLQLELEPLVAGGMASSDSRMVSAHSRCSGVRADSSSKSATPATAFMGVRISWLTTARNSLRARAARSADNLGWRALRCSAMDSLTGHKGRIRPAYFVNLQPGKHLPEDVKSRPAPRAPYQLAGLCLVLVAVIGVATYRYDLYEKEAIGREVRNQLLAIADMKVRQISDWRAERMGEAQVLTGSQALCNRLPYADAVLSDPRGRRVLSAGRKIGSDEHLRQLAEETVRQEDAAWRDFHRDGPGGAVHLGLNIPLRLAPRSPAFGALMLGIDPADYLYPLLQKWPT